jgi:hypothetical protein
MQSCAVKTGVVLLLAAVLAGCGGGSSSTKTSNVVAQVTLTPPTVSLVAGQVFSSFQFAALNSAGAPVSPVPTFTFNSSNTQVATVSPSGEVCGGVWDSFFIVCNPAPSSGNPMTAVITATAQGVTSAPVQVSVHPSVTSITVDPVAGCTSVKNTQQFVAHAFHNGTDITNLIGSFTWAITGTGATIDQTNGLATATVPGLTGVIARVGTTSSPAVDFRICMPVVIRLHVTGDPAGQPTEAATINVSDTKTIQADMDDENNVTTDNAPVTIFSNNSQVASVSGTTLTGVSPGGAGLVAACVPPACGNGLNLPVYSNLFNVTVNGSSPATTVYATSTFAPPSGTTPTLIPIDTSKTPLAAGTAINLPSNGTGQPAVPNSMLFTPDGTKAFLGTSVGIVTLATATNTATLVDGALGKVLAISPDGNNIIVSNAANAPDPTTGVVGPIETRLDHQRLVVLDAANNTAQSFVLPGAVAAAFTPDSSKAFIAVNCSPNPCPNGNGNVYVFSKTQTLQTTLNIGATVPSPPGTTDANNDVATLASGPFAYFANTAGLEVMGTCNNVQQPIANNPPITSKPQLVGRVANADMIVAVNSTGVDIETATVTPLAPSTTISSSNCSPTVAYSNQPLDFGQGPFTALQLLVPTSSAGHIVVLPAGKPQLLVTIPGGNAALIPLTEAGATQALSGSMTLDGNTAWVGVDGSNTVDQIILTNDPSKADALQIPTSFKKSDGSAAPPNLVGVKPK